MKQSLGEDNISIEPLNVDLHEGNAQFMFTIKFNLPPDSARL